MKKRILFVDDVQKVLDGLRRMLRPMRKEWKMEFTDSGAKALALMAEEPFDVIISDMRMPEMDGAELLTEVMRRYPSTVRIVLSGHSEKETVLRSVGPSHQYLAKPSEAETIKETVTRACALRSVLSSDRLAFISRIKNLPSIPEIYADLVKELKADEPSITRVAKLIETDIGMTSKILQLVNSAYFGIRKHISNPVTAVRLLGLENVSSLVLFAKVFSTLDESIPGLRMDEMIKHGAAVSRLSQEILKAEKRDKKEVDDALAAGLLHDCGKLVFAACPECCYGDVLKFSSEAPVPLYEAELEKLEASHAEAGACLLDLWGLPDSIVEAVAFHHTPRECCAKNQAVLTAVHVADALIQETGLVGTRAGVERLDTEYLESVGVADRLDDWKALVPQDNSHAG